MLDFPTLGFPASANVNASRSLQRPTSAWQPETTQVSLTKIFEATSRPTADSARPSGPEPPDGPCHPGLEAIQRDGGVATKDAVGGWNRIPVRTGRWIAQELRQAVGRVM